MARVALLQPGEMGAAVGACLVGRGHTVRWASAGRSEDTRRRAGVAGLEDAGDVAALLGDAEVVLSVCPPHAAVDVAAEVARCGFAGLYVDGNAISPQSAARVGRVVEAAGARWADGGIVGPPPREPGTTRLYLSGDAAPDAAALFEGSALDAVVLEEGGPTAASALKMAYAAWTKGSSALLLDARALADAYGVADALVAEWTASQPDLGRLLVQAATAASTKGWRWIGEMEEIAQSMREGGLPDGFHRAAAEVYRRVPRTRPAGGDDAVRHALRSLRDP